MLTKIYTINFLILVLYYNFVSKLQMRMKHKTMTNTSQFARKLCNFANQSVNNSGENFTGLRKNPYENRYHKCGAVRQKSADYRERKIRDVKRRRHKKIELIYFFFRKIPLYLRLNWFYSQGNSWKSKWDKISACIFSSLH